jgi:hypothetical protein
MPRPPQDENVARAAAGSGAVVRTGLTENEKRLIHEQRNREMGLTKARGSSGSIACEADQQPTILASQMVLRNLSVSKAAAKTGIREDRLSKIAAGAVKPDALEARNLERTFHESADVLVLENTAPNRAKLRIF